MNPDPDRSIKRYLRDAGENGTPVDLGLFEGLEGMLSVLINTGRNNIGPIKGYASLIQDETPDSSNERRWADKIMRSVRLMEDHLNTLDMFRIDGREGAQDLSWHRLISEVTDHFAAVNLKGVPIEIVNDTRGTFRQYGGLLKRVLVHLVVNAYESIEQSGKITLFVENLSATDDGRRRFAIRVSDTGVGIGGEAMKEIWQPFYTTKHNHIGLGLPYVTAAAAVMGMETELISSAGRGTSVGLLLTEQGG
jgi:signal transduction histidine kinase